MRLVGDEPEQIRSAMHDIQYSVMQYYRYTTGWPAAELLTTPARSTVAFIQKVHDALSATHSDGGVKNSARYREIFGRRLGSGDQGAETIEAFRYLRNIGQHLVFPVQPAEAAVFGGMHGLRSYNTWAFVPRRAHNRLRSGTQSLRPFYRSRLEGGSITDTFLAALAFYADVCPSAVHRSGVHNEWSWFPLRSQPGVTAPLHPEEPTDERAARRWLRRRLPGGELRVVLGQITLGGQPRIVGFTFAGELTYSPFVEAPETVQTDIKRGYAYFEPGHLLHLEVVSEAEVDCTARTGFRVPNLMDQLPDTPIAAPRVQSVDWTINGVGPSRLREECVVPVQSIYDMSEEPFIEYRARRLYADYPIF